jgi:tetrahydromethanopterin S-methyltransferase subunit G
MSEKKKIGRPKKSDADARTHCIPAVRLTAAEYAEAKKRAKAVDKCLTAYVRELATTGHVVSSNDPKQSFGAGIPLLLVNQLTRVGVNINQLTRVANSTDELPKSLADAGEDLQEVLDLLVEKIDF